MLEIVGQVGWQEMDSTQFVAGQMGTHQTGFLGQVEREVETARTMLQKD